MGILTPTNKEYNVVTGLITEGFSLWGQGCKIYKPIKTDKDSDRDSIHYYDGYTFSNILFSDDLTDIKMKGKNWSKERGDALDAYISLVDGLDINKGCVIDITPSFHNSNAKFIVSKVLGQVNSVYLKVSLVPYRESLAVEIAKDKDTSTKVDDGNLKVNKPFLKR